MINIIDRYFPKEKKTVLRKRYFKHSHKNYWMKKMEDGSIEFWAYSCVDDTQWFLGKHDKDKITECDGFYRHVLPWDVQKGAARLFEEFMSDLAKVDSL